MAALDRSGRTLIQVLRREITLKEALHDNAAWGFPALSAEALASGPMGLLATENGRRSFGALSRPTTWW